MTISVTDALDGSTHDFPDGTSPDVIKSAMARTRAAAAPQESFWQEFSRTRQEQLKAGEIKPRPEISMFKTPVKAVGQALATANLPFAYSGIGPLLDVATRRYIEPGAKELLSGAIPPFMRETEAGKTIADIAGKTAGLGAQMFLPGPLAESVLSKIARPSTLARLAEGEKLAGEATRTGEEAAALRETAIPRAAQAEEALTGKLKTAQRSLKRGEAELGKVPEAISGRKLTPYEAGAEYGGTTTQAKPRLEELGQYGRAAKQASEYFKKQYDPIREQVARVKIPVQDLEEIKRGVFEGVVAREGEIPERDLALQIVNQKLTPSQTKAAETAMVAAQKEGKPFTAKDLAGILSAEGPEGLSGKQVLDRVQVLRDQARQSGTDLISRIRNDLADRYLDRLMQSAPPGVQQQLNAVNEQYRRSREFFGREAIPRKLANEQASDILHAMFGPGKGRVERARIMREFLPKEKFDAYVRAFHENEFDPQNLKATLPQWKSLAPEIKEEMYGPALTKQLDRVVSGIERDQSTIGKMETALGKITEHGTKLERQAIRLEAQQKKLMQNATRMGYVIDPQSDLGKLIHSPAAQGLKYGALGFSGILGLEHVGRGLVDLAQHNTTMGMLQLTKALFFISPTMLPSMTKTMKGAKIAADVLNANRQDVWAWLAFRKFLADMGTSDQAEFEKIGLKKAQ